VVCASRLGGECVHRQLDELAFIGVECDVCGGRFAAPGGDVEDGLAERQRAVYLDVGVDPGSPAVADGPEDAGNS